MKKMKFPPLRNKYFLSGLIAIPYILYVGYIISINRGPIDYETFMSIGNRLLSGQPIYTENSYYPMPFVFIFSLFSAIPRPISMAIWMLGPVVCAWMILGKDPLVLLFAPLFGHFVGGQASVFGMIGLWGYRKYIKPNNSIGGVYLTLTLLKPQLGVVPFLYAFIQWVKVFRLQKKVPAQTWAWITSMGILFLPGFLIDPDWIVKWLQTPRPLFERALSGLIPRFLLFLFNEKSALYWVMLTVLGILLLIFLWHKTKGKISLDLAVIWSFIVSPLVHDYDLIQLIPLLVSPSRRVWAVIASIPGWLVILFAYTNDKAWSAFTIIAPGLLIAILLIERIDKKIAQIK